MMAFMKILISTLYALLIFGCAEKPNRTAAPPPTGELQAAVLKYLEKEPVNVPTKIELRGVALSEPKPDVFLVFADAAFNGEPIPRKFIGQKYNSGAASYWQVVPATPANLQALGITLPAATER